MLFNGAVWFRRDVELPPDWASPSTLCLGRIDDFDHTYVNGVLVGAHPQGTPLSIEIVREEIVQEYLQGVKIIDRRFDEANGTCSSTAVMLRQAIASDLPHELSAPLPDSAR